MLWRSNDCSDEEGGRGKRGRGRKGEVSSSRGRSREGRRLTPSQEDTRSLDESGEKVREEMVSLGGSRTTSEPGADMLGGEKGD